MQNANGKEGGVHADAVSALRGHPTRRWQRNSARGESDTSMYIETSLVPVERAPPDPPSTMSTHISNIVTLDTCSDGQGRAISGCCVLARSNSV